MLKEKLKNYRLILASGSPRRQQFFRELDLDFEIQLKPVEEVYPPHLKASEITDYLAELKALQFSDLKKDEILVTSDTIVWHKDKALGKPADHKEAFEMIQSLSGATHEVITSVFFKTKNLNKTVHSTTKVSFKEFSAEEIDYYINNFKPFDKAGAYGIQEWIGLTGISHIEGSYFNVVGLPTHLVYNTLMEIAEKISKKD